MVEIDGFFIGVALAHDASQELGVKCITLVPGPLKAGPKVPHGNRVQCKRKRGCTRLRHIIHNWFMS